MVNSKEVHLGDWIRQDWKRLLAGAVTTIAIAWALIWVAIDYYDARVIQVPQLGKKVDKLETDLQAAVVARETLQQSIAETDVLRLAIALIPGDIRQISRNAYISYAESTPSIITQHIEAQSFQWRVQIKQEESGRYSGLVGYRIWGLPTDGGEESNDPEIEKLQASMREYWRNLGLFINAAERIDLGSHEPQLLARTSDGLSTLGPTPDQQYEIYIVIEKNQDENRRWRCALIATMPHR